MTLNTLVDADHRRTISEVLELGETLFDAVLETAALCPAKDFDEPFPEDEMRTAADEFFRALRVLLELEGDA